VLLLGAGCGDDRAEPAPTNADMLAGAVGFGEGRDTDYGSHKVNELVDPIDLAEAREAGLRTASSERVVAAVISECAREGQATTLSSSGWSALLSDGSQVTSTVPPAPATEGAPSIDASRRVAAGKCAYARVLFVVTEADQVDGFHYESDGARTATWRESVGTTGLP